MPSTQALSPIHCATSIARFGLLYGLRTSEKLVLYALWSMTPDPFAHRPRVATSYGRLADVVQLSRVSLPRIVLRLVSFGCLTRLPSSPAGTVYVLERPEHLPDDVDSNPFAPTAAATFAEAVADLAVPRVLDRIRNRRARTRVRLPAVEPSLIALALEDMAGLPPHVVDGKRSPSIRFSGQGAAAVRAAQRWISKHGLKQFRDVCSRAREHAFTDLPEPQDRVFLFDRARALAELTIASDPPSADTVVHLPEPDDEISPVHSGRPRLRARLADELGLANASAIESRLLDFADERERSLVEIHEALDGYVALAPSDRQRHELHEVLA